MKFKKSLALILALLMIIPLLFTGCDKADVADGADNSAVEDDVEGYAWWWSWLYGPSYYSSSKNTQKATQKATQKPTEKATQSTSTSSKNGATLAQVMTYNGKSYAEVYNNQPDFQKSDLTTKAYEYYSPLDSLGRCGYAMACVGTEIMPTEKRGSISSVTPTGWKQKTYDTSIISTQNIYNRSHLIGFQLTGENANKKNLITGTRYMNENMIPFEDMIADYVKETGNHVLYRVTPIFEGNNLLASGVHMEAYSVEDNGDGVCFNVYLYNVQPKITINYATGENWLTSSSSSSSSSRLPELSIFLIRARRRSILRTAVRLI